MAGWGLAAPSVGTVHGDAGTAARYFPALPFSDDELRFFYCPKAGRAERVGNHPTVKPVLLMRWLVRLLSPVGGVVVDPFCGTGTTLVACVMEGRLGLGIDNDAQPGSVETARGRVRAALNDDTLFAPGLAVGARGLGRK